MFTRVIDNAKRVSKLLTEHGENFISNNVSSCREILSFLDPSINKKRSKRTKPPGTGPDPDQSTQETSKEQVTRAVKRRRLMECSTPLDYRMSEAIDLGDDSPILISSIGDASDQSKGSVADGSLKPGSSPGNSREMDLTKITPTKKVETSSDFEIGATSLMNAAAKANIIFTAEAKESISDQLADVHLDGIDFSIWSDGSSFNNNSGAADEFVAVFGSLDYDIFVVEVPKTKKKTTQPSTPKPDVRKRLIFGGDAGDDILNVKATPEAPQIKRKLQATPQTPTGRMRKASFSVNVWEEGVQAMFDPSDSRDNWSVDCSNSPTVGPVQSIQGVSAIKELVKVKSKAPVRGCPTKPVARGKGKRSYIKRKKSGVGMSDMNQILIPELFTPSKNGGKSYEGGCAGGKNCPQAGGEKRKDVEPTD